MRVLRLRVSGQPGKRRRLTGVYAGSGAYRRTADQACPRGSRGAGDPLSPLPRPALRLVSRARAGGGSLGIDGRAVRPGGARAEAIPRRGGRLRCAVAVRNRKEPAAPLPRTWTARGRGPPPARDAPPLLRGRLRGGGRAAHLGRSGARAALDARVSSQAPARGAHAARGRRALVRRGGECARLLGDRGPAAGDESARAPAVGPADGLSAAP